MALRVEYASDAAAALPTLSTALPALSRIWLLLELETTAASAAALDWLLHCGDSKPVGGAVWHRVY